METGPAVSWKETPVSKALTKEAPRDAFLGWGGPGQLPVPAQGGRRACRGSGRCPAPCVVGVPTSPSPSPRVPGPSASPRGSVLPGFPREPEAFKCPPRAMHSHPSRTFRDVWWRRRSCLQLPRQGAVWASGGSDADPEATRPWPRPLSEPQACPLPGGRQRLPCPEHLCARLGWLASPRPLCSAKGVTVVPTPRAR